MLLYHGSNTAILSVDLQKCRPYKDFGRGFYLTSIEKQAALMAKRVCRLFGGKSWVTAFEFDSSALTADELRVKVFAAVDADWAAFVLNNRNRSFADHADKNSNHDNKYDIVVGPVANDDIALQLRLFESGVFDIDSLANSLEYKKMNDQYSFHTEKALGYLSRMEATCYEQE